MSRSNYVIIACLVSAARALAEDTADHRKLADFIMTGIRDSRERLRQGIVEGRGKRESMQDDGQKREYDFHFFYAFDWDKHIFRVEREEPRTTTNGEVFTSRQIYFRQPGRSVQHDTRWGEIQILREDFGIRWSLHAFDLRCAGMLYRDNYEQRMPLNEVLDSFTTQAEGEAFDEGAGNFRVRWILDDVMRRTIWVNRREGFSVTRFEVSDRRVPPMPLQPDGWPAPFLTNDATWTKIKDVWVPKTFRIDDRDGPDDSKPYTRYTHEFEWESVNEPLPDDVTDIDKVGAKKGTLVVNYQGKASIVERVIGIENTRLEGEVRRKHERRTAPQPRGTLRWQRLFVVGNAVVLVIVLIIVATRIWKRRGATGPGPR